MLIAHTCFLCKRVLHAHTSHNIKGHFVCKRCMYPNMQTHKLGAKRYSELLNKVKLEELKRKTNA